MTVYELRHDGDRIAATATPEEMLDTIEHLKEHEDDDGLEVGLVDCLVVAIKADTPVSLVDTGFGCPECGSLLTAAAGRELSGHVGRLLDDYPHLDLDREPGWFDHPLHAVLYCEREACGVGAPVTLENDRFEVLR